MGCVLMGNEAETQTGIMGAQVRSTEPSAWRLQLHRPAAKLLAELSEAIGCPLPERSGRAMEAAGLAVMWLAPAEWLLVGDGSRARAAIAATCEGQLHAYHDVSDEIAGFEIEGHGAATLLNLGCSLDLRELAFPTGSATRTLFAQVGIVLHRFGDEAFRVIVDRSYGRYVAHWLAETASDVELPIA